MAEPSFEDRVEAPIRAEIFSVERLEQYAEFLSTELVVSEAPKVVQKLLPRMRENGDTLLASYRALVKGINEKEAMTPGAEWLVDNFHIVEDQLREIRQDLPVQFYKELPKLAVGELAGYPRIYALALAIVAHTDSRIEVETTRRFIQAFQGKSPLKIGELWALAITLRLVLVENLRRLTDRIIWDRKKRSQADTLADQLLENIKNEDVFAQLVNQIPWLCYLSSSNDCSLISQLAKRLRDQEPELWPAVEAMEKHLTSQNTSTEQVVRLEHQIQAANQVTVANIITSMRLLSSIDWKEFFESVSLVEQVLRADPLAAYANMNFATRDLYRHRVEKIARRFKRSELDIASKAIELAEQASEKTKQSGVDPRKSHVGYYLLEPGAKRLFRSFFPGKILRRPFPAAKPVWIYFGSLAICISVILLPALLYASKNLANSHYLIWIGLCLLLPASELAQTLNNFFITRVVPPARIPKMDLSSGIPEEARTLVVIPCILSSKATIDELLERLEIHFLRNDDANLSFALLGDLADAESEVMSTDANLLDHAHSGIDRLNSKYPGNRGARFALLHRKRLFNANDKIWMGWERKRGKLHELNLLLRGHKNTNYILDDKSLFLREQFRFVITLDADTQLPRDSARTLIGTMMHPLNRPRFDRKSGRIVEGYGILQPRIGITLESSAKSLFAKIYAGYIGIDPYTTAVSDVYQDLFSEGSFVGKGIYDIDAFEAALRDRAPENQILSHDLFEGIFARTALITDVELLDNFPSTYGVFYKRLHRWIRGDWQIAAWLFPYVRDAKGRWKRNDIPLVSRWKIFDNLRRSLVAPAMVLWIVLALSVFPGSAFVWLMMILAVQFGAVFLHAVDSLLIELTAKQKKRSFSFYLSDLKNNAFQSALYVVFLGHQAWVQLDAIARVFYRNIWSKQNMLEWATAAQTEKQRAGKGNAFWQMEWPTQVFLLGVFFILLWQGYASPLLALFIFLWASYPWVAKWIDCEIAPLSYGLDETDRDELRRIARRTWNYFATFVTEKDNYLPPDNFQEDPEPVVAHRTSPTNIGIYMLAAVAARDFGYLGVGAFLQRIQQTLVTLKKLEKHEGHLFNWYDTESLQPLLPKYVSTVDSGNLAGYLLAVKQACLEILDKPILEQALFSGWYDLLILAEEEESKQLFGDEKRLLLKQIPPSKISLWAERFSTLLNTFLALKSQLSTPAAKYWIEQACEEIHSALDDLKAISLWLALPDSFLPQSVDWVRRLDSAVSPRKMLQELTLASKELSIGSDAKQAIEKSEYELLRRLRSAEESAQSLDSLFHQMSFKFLLDPQRGVFSIGYNQSENRVDASFYDLLASESRLASFVSIAKGDVPQEHWFRLGRQLVPAMEGRALISWSASMFEYMMPMLVMRNYQNTLLDETLHAVVAKQISYGSDNSVPWGISEAGYNARDLQLNYQYGPFGIPGLGLKRGLSHDLVISPYSTLLAAMVDLPSSLQNIRVLIGHSLLTKFGFYESVDYTADRRPEAQQYAVIRSFMAHHQGMSFVSLDNIINANAMQNRFHAEPCVRATELLLQERVPRASMATLPKAAEVEMEEELRANINSFVRHYDNPRPSSPRVQLLSNGSYSAMVSTSGAGYSKCDGVAVTRWREDATRDNWGSFVFISDIIGKRIWSSTYQPLTASLPDSYRVTFGEEKVDFRRQDGDIKTHTEILVAPEDNVEIRQVSICNMSEETRVFELTSYLEPVLSPANGDLAHPAFIKLFIETEYVPSKSALLAKRRKRSASEAEFWGVHLVTSDSPFLSEVEYETDREQFIGRNRSLLQPNALFTNSALRCESGVSFDPILSLRAKVEVGPGKTVRVAFTTGLATSREKALELADRYHDIQSFEREAKIAWTTSQVDLRHLNIDAETAYIYQRIAEKILYSDPAVRPPSDRLAQNASTQSKLWAHGISGDLPIVALTIHDGKDIGILRKLLRCHEYLRLKGLAFDFVILNEQRGQTIYLQELQEEIQQQLRMTGLQSWLNKSGGIFSLRSDITHQRDFDQIRAAARISLFADQTLKDQMARKKSEVDSQRNLIVSAKAPSTEAKNLKEPEVDFFNGYGGFSKDGREYVIALPPGVSTPAPWINVIGNEHDFGFQISESGSSFTWSINSQANRLTAWSNDPVCDPSGEIIYLRDENGWLWSPTPQPILSASNYIVRHSAGYSVFEHLENGILSKLTVFTPSSDSVKVSLLELKNTTTKRIELRVTSYTEWVLGSQREKTAPYIICDTDPESGAIFASNPFDNEFATRVSFADISENPRSFTCSRKEFLGRNGDYSNPYGLELPRLSGKKGTGQDPCAALQCKVVLLPGEEKTLSITLGQAADAGQARALALRYRDSNLARLQLQIVQSQWQKITNFVQVRTPDRKLDLLMNSWLLYQTLSCRFWSRTAFYQSGGAFGFRDQLQDSMAFVYSRPDLTRSQILRSAARQFEEGDVQHWWHPPSGRGVRTKMSDDLLWLPYVVSFYLRVTGDESILAEQVAFIKAPLLQPEQEDSYTEPQVTENKASVLEHCIRAIDRSLKFGAHGLPLIGTGDWNDGMNRVGLEGKGESVWLGWFLYKVILDFLPLLEAKEKYTECIERLKTAIEATAWDGQWYRRAYFDDGTPLGSSESIECKIDSIAQSWSILSTAGDPERSKIAMQKLDENLVARKSQLVKLLTPAFDKTTSDPGYIKGYVPGVRENGGQYTHAAVWAVMAFAHLGQGDKAMELFGMINPINHSLSERDAQIYRIEPYVLAGDVYSGGNYEGRGGWSWYTGSSAWYYRACLESLLGFTLRQDRLSFNPCIPTSWKSFSITYVYKNSVYEIEIANPEGLSKGRVKIELDGIAIEGSELLLTSPASAGSGGSGGEALDEKTQRHRVKVTLLGQ